MSLGGCLMGVFYMIPPEFGPCGPTVTAAAHGGYSGSSPPPGNISTTTTSITTTVDAPSAALTGVRCRRYSGPTGPIFERNHVQHSHNAPSKAHGHGPCLSGGLGKTDLNWGSPMEMGGHRWKLGVTDVKGGAPTPLPSGTPFHIGDPLFPSVTPNFHRWPPI